MQFSVSIRTILRLAAPSIPKIGDWNTIQYRKHIVNLRQPLASLSNKSKHQDTVSVPDSSTILNKPKRPPPVFLRYVKLVQPELIRQFPQAKRKEIIRIASERYKCADDEILSNLRSEYERDVDIYEKLVQIFQLKEPKRPTTVFSRFVKLIEPEVIREFPEATKSERIRIASKKYSSANKELIDSLRDQLSKEKEQYEKEFEKYEVKLSKQQKYDLKLKRVVRPKRTQRSEEALSDEHEKKKHVKIANELDRLPKEEKIECTAKVEKQSENYKLQKARREKNAFNDLKNEIMEEYGVSTRKSS